MGRRRSCERTFDAQRSIPLIGLTESGAGHQSGLQVLAGEKQGRKLGRSLPSRDYESKRAAGINQEAEVDSA